MNMTLQQAMKVAAELEERGCLNEPAKAARTLLAHINSLASPQVTDEQIQTIYQAVGFLEREGYYQIAGKLSLIHALLSAPPAAVKINLPSISPLRLFVGAAVPCSTEIDPRGYQWCEPYLDAALSEVNALSAPLEAEAIGEITLAGWRIDWDAKHPNSVGATRWVGVDNPAYKERLVDIGGVAVELFEKEEGLFDYRTLFKGLAADMGAVAALLGIEHYTGVQPVLRAITDLILKSDADNSAGTKEPVAYLNPNADCVDEAFHWTQSEKHKVPVYERALLSAPPAAETPVAWTDDQMIRFASMILIQGNRPESIEMRLQTFRGHEELRGHSRPEAKPVAADLTQAVKEVRAAEKVLGSVIIGGTASDVGLPFLVQKLGYAIDYLERAAAPQEEAPADKDAIRNAALEEASEAVTDLFAEMDEPYLPDINAAILALQSQPQQVTK